MHSMQPQAGLGMTRCEFSQYFLDCALKLDFRDVCSCNKTSTSLQTRKRIPDVEKWMTNELTDDDCDIVFAHWMPSLCKMSMDQHANYVVQKLIERVSPALIKQFMSESAGWHDMIQHKFGSRVVQVLAGIDNGAFVPDLLGKIGGRFGTYAMDTRGNYVMQAVASHAPVSSLVTLVQTVVPHAVPMSVHPHGSHVLQTVLQRIPEILSGSAGLSPQAKVAALHMCDALLVSLVRLGPSLIQNPHGNFSAQVMVEPMAFCPCARRMFVHEMCDKLVKYAQCPFGVRVIERVLENQVSDDNDSAGWMRNQIVDHIVSLRMREFEQCMLLSSSAAFLVKKLKSSTTGNQLKAVERRLSRMASAKRHTSNKRSAKHKSRETSMSYDLNYVRPQWPSCVNDRGTMKVDDQLHYGRIPDVPVLSSVSYHVNFVA